MMIHPFCKNLWSCLLELIALRISNTDIVEHFVSSSANIYSSIYIYI